MIYDNDDPMGEQEFDEDIARAMEHSLSQGKRFDLREYFQAQSFHDECGDR